SQYPFDYNQHSFSMTTSAGLTCFKPGDKIEDVFRRADSALYQAKEQGRNCCVTQ
ncbi:MAG TPA: GGDEF domain-containing protein, partial [Gammaproteobacteria bacterium]|nr:GGDEF domain-containing protein [Gammaproteobacteria bacterium]